MAENERGNSSVDPQKPSARKSARLARSAKALRENLKKRRQQVRDRENPGPSPKDEK